MPRWNPSVDAEIRTINSAIVAMNCPHCGNLVSPQAAACPHCGHPFARAGQTFHQGVRREKTYESLAVLLFIAAAVAALIVGNVFAAWAGLAVLVVGALAAGALYFLA